MFQSRCDGGCWFCQDHKEGDLYLFSDEFDAYVHEECLLGELDDNPEKQIMMEEFGFMCKQSVELLK